jgi:excisionase family DNA binding protein
MVQGNRISGGVPRVALTIEEACESLGCSWDWWREHVAPEIRMVRRGRKRLVPLAELVAWVDRNAATALEDVA